MKPPKSKKTKFADAGRSAGGANGKPSRSFKPKNSHSNSSHSTKMKRGKGFTQRKQINDRQGNGKKPTTHVNTRNDNNALGKKRKREEEDDEGDDNDSDQDDEVDENETVDQFSDISDVEDDEELIRTLDKLNKQNGRNTENADVEDEKTKALNGLDVDDFLIDSGLEDDDDDDAEAEEDAALNSDGETDDLDDDEPKSDGKKSKKKSAAEEFTPKSWAQLQKAVFKDKSMSGLKKLLRIFRIAAHASSNEISTKRNQKGQSTTITSAEESVKFANSSLYLKVIRACAKDLPALIAEFLEFELPNPDALQNTSATSTQHDKQTSFSGDYSRRLPSLARWKSLQLLIRSYLTNYLYLCSHVIEPQMLRFLITCVQPALVYFDCFPKLLQKLFKQCISLWSNSEKMLRIDCFLTIRLMCILCSPSHMLLESALKVFYLTYVKNAKFYSAQTAGIVEFMANCIVEIYSLDPVTSYQHAFVYIRQLGIHLRNAMHTKKGMNESDGKKKQPPKKKKKGDTSLEGHAAVYNWQFVNCLRVWCKLLAAHCVPSTSISPTKSSPSNTTQSISIHKGFSNANKDASPLRALLYPLVSVCTGLITLISSSRYHPLRLHVAQFLIQLSSSSQTYIAMLPTLISILTSAILSNKHSKSSSSQKNTDLRYLLKVSKTSASSRYYQDQVVERTISLMVLHLSVYSRNIAFPELVIPPIRHLRRFIKSNKVVRFKKQISALVNKLETNAQWVNNKRANMDIAPKDMKGSITQIVVGKNELSPLDRYVQMEKDKTDNEKQSIADENNADWSGKQSKHHREDEQGSGSDDSSGEEPSNSGKSSRDSGIDPDDWDDDDDTVEPMTLEDDEFDSD